MTYSLLPPGAGGAFRACHLLPVGAGGVCLLLATILVQSAVADRHSPESRHNGLVLECWKRASASADFCLHVNHAQAT